MRSKILNPLTLPEMVILSICIFNLILMFLHKENYWFHCLFGWRLLVYLFLGVHESFYSEEASPLRSESIIHENFGLFTYTGQHRLSSHFWSSMQAGWCRSRNKPLISARLRLASALLPVDSSLERRNYIWEWKKKNRENGKKSLFNSSETTSASTNRKSESVQQWRMFWKNSRVFVVVVSLVFIFFPIFDCNDVTI